MAIKFNERYPGRSLAPSTRYPQGGFKNRSAPDSKDGTYLEQDWANDISGFLQFLMREAEITANGQVDDAIRSQYAEALSIVVKKWMNILQSTGNNDSAVMSQKAVTDALNKKPSADGINDIGLLGGGGNRPYMKPSASGSSNIELAVVKGAVEYSGGEYVLSGMTGNGAWKVPDGYVVTGIRKTGDYFDTTTLYCRKLRIS